MADGLLSPNGKIRVPKTASLRRYGLTAAEWLAILADQGGVCAICKKVPPSGRLVTDHEHVTGWKQMPPEKRKLFVRGVICWTDNHYLLGRGITLAKAEAVVYYLRKHGQKTAPADVRPTPPRAKKLV